MPSIVRTSPSTPIANAVVTASGSRLVTWTATGIITVLDAATGTPMLALGAPDRVLALDEDDHLACIARPRGDDVDIALWDLVTGARIGPLVGIRPRPGGIAMGSRAITTVHLVGKRSEPPRPGHRMRFDRSGALLADDLFRAGEHRGLPIWVREAPRALDAVVRVTWCAEVLLLPRDEEADVAIGAPIERSDRVSHAVRGTFGGTDGSCLAVHLVGPRRARVVDLRARRVVDGPWDALAARAAFFCGERVVIATDDAIEVFDLDGDRLASRSASGPVARVGEHRIAIGEGDSVTVVDVARDVSVTHRDIGPVGGVFGGHDRVVVTHPEGGVTCFAAT